MPLIGECIIFYLDPSPLEEVVKSFLSRLSLNSPEVHTCLFFSPSFNWHLLQWPNLTLTSSVYWMVVGFFGVTLVSLNLPTSPSPMGPTWTACGCSRRLTRTPGSSSSVTPFRWRPTQRSKPCSCYSWN